jgi:DNA-binding transcriptional ArsR family regulator
MDIKTFSALAELKRFRIVEILIDCPLTVRDIAERIQLRQPQTSKHLHVLLEAGLVEFKAVVNRRNYCLRLETFQALDAWIETFRGIWDEPLDAIEDYLQKLRILKKQSKLNFGRNFNVEQNDFQGRG